MAETIHARYSLRRATAAVWASSNEVLGAGEVGLETDTGRTKVGDGTTGWTALNYGVSGAVSGLGSIADGQGLKWDAASGLFVPGDLGKVYQAGAGITIANPTSATPTINGSGITLSGRAATYSALPAQPVTAGTAYLCDADGQIYVSNGSAWPAQGTGVAAGSVAGMFHAQRLAAQSQIKSTFVNAGDVAYYWDFRDPACYGDASGAQLPFGTNALSLVDCFNSFALKRYSGMTVPMFDPVASTIAASMTQSAQFNSYTFPNLASAWGGNHDMTVVARAAEYATSGLNTLFFLGYPSSNNCFAIGSNYSRDLSGAFRYDADAQIAPARGNTPYAYAGVKSGTSLLSYFDAVLAKTSTAASSNITTNFIAVGGNGVDAAPCTAYYLGLFIINRALSSAEVAQLGTML